MADVADDAAAADGESLPAAAEAAARGGPLQRLHYPGPRHHPFGVKNRVFFTRLPGICPFGVKIGPFFTRLPGEDGQGDQRGVQVYLLARPLQVHPGQNRILVGQDGIARSNQGASRRSGGPDEHRPGFGVPAPYHCRHPMLENPGFLRRYLFPGISKDGAVVQPDGSNHAQTGLNHIRAVQQATQPHLYNGIVHGLFGEPLECHARGDFKK